MKLRGAVFTSFKTPIYFTKELDKQKSIYWISLYQEFKTYFLTRFKLNINKKKLEAFYMLSFPNAFNG